MSIRSKGYVYTRGQNLENRVRGGCRTGSVFRWPDSVAIGQARVCIPCMRAYRESSMSAIHVRRSDIRSPVLCDKRKKTEERKRKKGEGNKTTSIRSCLSISRHGNLREALHRSDDNDWLLSVCHTSHCYFFFFFFFFLYWPAASLLWNRVTIGFVRERVEFRVNLRGLKVANWHKVQRILAAFRFSALPRVNRFCLKAAGANANTVPKMRRN